MFGGAVPDAMLAMIKLLGTLWDDEGSVAIAGMMARDAATPAYSEEQLRADTGLLEGVTPIGAGSIMGRIWNKPAVTVTGIDFTPEIGPRRPGDPDRIVATGELAARDLDWTMRYSVDEMVRTGWEARQAARP